MDTSSISTEMAHLVVEKSNDKEREIAVQFSFYKDKTNMLRNCKKLNFHIRRFFVRDNANL